MHFGMFNTCLQQHLLVNNAIATLNDIGVTAEVAHYWSAMLEFRDARRELAAAKNKILHVQEKQAATKGHLFRARVFTHICHLIFDSSIPPIKATVGLKDFTRG
jgi:hypothetical protein